MSERVKKLPRKERAQVDGLEAALAKLAPALEDFSRFARPDTAQRRDLWQPLLAEALPEHGAGAEAVLRTLAEVVIPHGSRLGHPGFSGWITTMPTTITAAANLAASWVSPQRWWVHPGNFLDSLSTRWLSTLLGFPERFQGVLVSGGAMANLIGLGTARQHAMEKLGIDPTLDGVQALPLPRIYASSDVHHVVGRAMSILGLGRRQLRTLSTEGGGIDVAELERMLTEDVRAGCTPVALVASAGDVNTGRIDPIPEMQAIARRHGVWLHVDGAYGGFGVLDPRVRGLYGDLAAIDSFAVDPHKWLAVPVGCGACFVRDADLLGRAFAIEPGEYVRMQSPSAGNPGSPFDERGEGSPDFAIDFSTPSRGVAVWAALKEIGAEGMRARVARHLDCARRVAARVAQHSELELLAEPVLSICCFRFRAPGLSENELDALNEAILLTVRARGHAIPSSTRVAGKFAIRPCFINPRTEIEEADLLVDEVLAAGRSAQASAK